MSITLSKPSKSDADAIARLVEVPSMQTGPLFRTMFPKPLDSLTEAQREETNRFYVEMLENMFEDGNSYLKASLEDDEGTPVGFCGWTIVERDLGEGTAEKTDEGKNGVKEGKKKKGICVPAFVDWDAWTALSKALRTERERVLKDLDTVTRLTSMAVSPSHQRQGIGSMMMDKICEKTDRYVRHAYVLASPEGMCLYRKFGFEIVGGVETPHGVIVSMLRMPVEV